MSKKIIGVFGPGNVSEADEAWQAAFSVGQQLAQSGFVVLTGGLGGVMTAASKGAKEEGGLTVGVLPGTSKSSPANAYVDIPVYTGMAEARNAINVKSCQAAIAIGGEYGTLSEIALALKGGCPIIYSIHGPWHHMAGQNNLPGLLPKLLKKLLPWQLHRCKREVR